MEKKVNNIELNKVSGGCENPKHRLSCKYCGSEDCEVVTEGSGCSKTSYNHCNSCGRDF